MHDNTVMNYTKGGKIVKKGKLLVLTATIGFTLASFNLVELDAEKIDTTEKVFSTDSLNEVDLQKKINSLNFDSSIPESKINSLSEATLNELSKDEGEIISIQKLNKNLDTGDPSLVQPFTMPKSDFELDVVVQRISEKGDNYDNFKFVATGDWKETPFFEFTDVIAIAWSDDFTLYRDYAYIDHGWITTNQTRKKVDNEKGVAYNVDLEVGETDKEAVLVAKVYKSNSSGEANVSAEYGHVELTARSVTVGFSGSDISMSVGIGANLEMASPDYAYFDY